MPHATSGGGGGGWAPARKQAAPLRAGSPDSSTPSSRAFPPLSAQTLLSLTQTGPPSQDTGHLLHTTEASGLCFHLPHPASSAEPGGKLSTTLGGGWEQRCLVQGGSWKPWSWIAALSRWIKGAQSRAARRAGPAGLLWSKARGPFPPLPGWWDARQHEGLWTENRRGVGRHKGQGPPGCRGGLSQGKEGSAWLEAACSVDRVPPGSCLE